MDHKNTPASASTGSTPPFQVESSRSANKPGTAATIDARRRDWYPPLALIILSVCGYVVWEYTAADNALRSYADDSTTHSKYTVVTSAATAVAPSPQPKTILEVRSNNGYQVPGSINGTAVTFKIDPQDQLTSLPASLARLAGLSCELKVSATLDGPETFCSGIATEVRFGPFWLTDRPVAIVPDGHPAVIGRDALQHFMIAWRHGVVRIGAPADHPPENKDSIKGPGSA